MHQITKIKYISIQDWVRLRIKSLLLTVWLKCTMKPELFQTFTAHRSVGIYSRQTSSNWKSQESFVLMQKCIAKRLTHLMSLFSFYTPWKHPKTCGFLMLLRGIERDQVTWNGSTKTYSRDDSPVDLQHIQWLIYQFQITLIYILSFLFSQWALKLPPFLQFAVSKELWLTL